MTTQTSPLRLAAAAALLLIPVAVSSQTDTRLVRAYHVQGNVWVITGAGANITVQASDARAAGPGAGEGILLVDSGTAEMTPQVLAEINRISPKRIEYVVNTRLAPDHVGGNETFAKPRMDFLWTPGTVMGPGVKVIAYETVATHMSRRGADNKSVYPSGAWPNATYSGAQKKIFFNDEPIVISHEPAASSDGDSVVFFRRSDVISAGDVFLTTSYPIIDHAAGGGVAGLISALERLLDLMVPRYNQEGGTLIVPGHGRVGDQHDVLEYHDMLVIVRDRVQAAAKKGATLDQIRAMRPTLDYDARWAPKSGPWTTDRFIEAIFEEVGGPR